MIYQLLTALLECLNLLRSCFGISRVPVVIVCVCVYCIDSASLLHNAEYTICLNAIGTGSQLYVHTSKPPKPGSAPFRILQVSY